MEAKGTLSTVWDKHVGAEFAAKDADQTVATMTADTYVNLIPLMIGAAGRDGVRDFYANHFLSQLPPDIEIIPVSRTIGQDQVVDELIFRFTHSIRMGSAPHPADGKRVEVPFVAIIRFQGDKIAREHLYWDQASLLVQLDLLDRALPVRGGEIAAQVLSPTCCPRSTPSSGRRASARGSSRGRRYPRSLRRRATSPAWGASGSPSPARRASLGGLESRARQLSTNSALPRGGRIGRRRRPVPSMAYKLLAIAQVRWRRLDGRASPVARARRWSTRDACS